MSDVVDLKSIYNTSVAGYGCEKMGGDSHWEVEKTRVVCKPLEEFYCYYDPGKCTYVTQENLADIT